MPNQNRTQLQVADAMRHLFNIANEAESDGNINGAIHAVKHAMEIEGLTLFQKDRLKTRLIILESLLPDAGTASLQRAFDMPCATP